MQNVVSHYKNQRFHYPNDQILLNYMYNPDDENDDHNIYVEFTSNIQKIIRITSSDQKINDDELLLYHLTSMLNIILKFPNYKILYNLEFLRVVFLEAFNSQSFQCMIKSIQICKLIIMDKNIFQLYWDNNIFDLTHSFFINSSSKVEESDELLIQSISLFTNLLISAQSNSINTSNLQCFRKCLNEKMIEIMKIDKFNKKVLAFFVLLSKILEIDDFILNFFISVIEMNMNFQANHTLVLMIIQNLTRNHDIGIKLLSQTHIKDIILNSILNKNEQLKDSLNVLLKFAELDIFIINNVSNFINLALNADDLISSRVFTFLRFFWSFQENFRNVDFSELIPFLVQAFERGCYKTKISIAEITCNIFLFNEDLVNELISYDVINLLFWSLEIQISDEYKVNIIRAILKIAHHSVIHLEFTEYIVNHIISNENIFKESLNSENENLRLSSHLILSIVNNNHND
ncbi:hypothetical protein TRFO_37773 [Tritrichomonas foetus]|uniref:Uncharacterized protein n=1 Tax=Tritrichomonas foetus TaxID=1144522 RepID=A0A1J4JF72_9EUKA|nr:hypothetical protein TRFO_37773 [Tritrichomonas foetus]|eukprot:OHS96101.1 hypothetical protein TRFO_37773 [Tritrichomonas foetus]